MKLGFSLWNIRAGKGLFSPDVCSFHANKKKKKSENTLIF